ncbi:hypothetical protein PSMK_01620 [Phycisphaera mikurensis NBRC 102666]|uniref:Uncharacterized protein n=1 Tax=Phycisphaera mikurensis (strain NBRC 102666 / KCTC 22515 / FYK2301M01) TaxID=1142394 RepID=I0IAN3_PHYMF|nr:hypothetical protein PSMK_01620 [Phycisphaera mikurensis NBRC 102666]
MAAKCATIRGSGSRPDPEAGLSGRIAAAGRCGRSACLGPAGTPAASVCAIR